MHPDETNDDETEAIVEQSRASADAFFDLLRGRRQWLTGRRSNLATAIEAIDAELGAVHIALEAQAQHEQAQASPPPSVPSHAYAVK